ncbi:MAG: AbrB/MazE/SpoVT family DNA-binding domain-containing protein [Thermofilaceae archaeon]
MKLVEGRARMDRQGRIVLPVRIRKALGLREGGELLVRLDGARIILEPIPGDLEESVGEWVKLALNLKLEARPERVGEGWKWVSAEYARRKLGLS